MQEVKVIQRSVDALAAVLTPEQQARFHAAAERAAGLLAGRVVWNVSSTATGGGVAEMLHTLLGYVSGAGVTTRWLVLAGDGEFFGLTKRLHNAVHGLAGGGPFGRSDHDHYRAVLDRNLPGLLGRLGPDDLVLLHDPQTAGMVGAVQAAGVPAIWRSHIGRDRPNDASNAAWDFLRRYVEPADGFVFSRLAYAPDWVPTDRLTAIPPSIDPLSPKNRFLDPQQCVQVLTRAGVLSGGAVDDTRSGSCVVEMAGAPAPDPATRLVVQVSRWDRLKDMPGVIAAFGRLPDAVADVHLMLVGFSVTGVTDDPEGADVLAACTEVWKELPPATRDRVHLVSVPTDDPVANATIVNAVQRHAAVVTQKSLAEGFGLTVTEAMWKARPVVASAVGGIQDQIVDGRDGLLVDDPTDLDAFAAAVTRPLVDTALADRLGRAAHLRVRDRFLGDRHLGQYVDLAAAVLDRRPRDH